MNRKEVIKRMCQITSKAADHLRKGSDCSCYCNADAILTPDKDSDFKFDPDVLDFVNEAVMEKIETIVFSNFGPIINQAGAVDNLASGSISHITKLCVDLIDRFFKNSNINDSESARRVVELLIIEELGVRLGEGRLRRRLATQRAKNGGPA